MPTITINESVRVSEFKSTVIGDDFVIDYVNKRIWNKNAWGQGGSSTVYSVNALYSWLMNTFDEIGRAHV